MRNEMQIAATVLEVSYFPVLNIIKTLQSKFILGLQSTIYH